MPDIFTKAKRSAVMAAIRSRGNKGTEVRMVALFRAQGIKGWRRQQKLRCEFKGDAVIRGRKNQEPANSSPKLTRHVSVDFIFRRERVAVFVDGCFWHACPRHGTMPAGNRAFWKAKLARNAERDRSVTRGLRKAGWKVLRVWEHDLAAKHWPRVVRKVVCALER